MVAALLIFAITLSIGVALYRWWWNRRYGDPPARLGGGVIRMRCRVLGPGAEGAGEVASRGSFCAAASRVSHLVVRTNAALVLLGRHRDLRVGDRLTVDGIATRGSARQDERLYRQPPQDVLELEATRVMGGWWPRLRWLPVVCGALFVAAGLAMTRPFRYERMRTVRFVSAAFHSCPEGTTEASVVSAAGITRFCRRPDLGWAGYEDGCGSSDPPWAPFFDRHGPCVAWSWEGAVRAWGTYAAGKRHGVWYEWRRPGIEILIYDHGVVRGLPRAASAVNVAPWRPGSQFLHITR